mmetsp:Transcript_4072/g.6301  ORF Transcript_4072/g.6301 Transcript_4072/m.6301 type:complete len:714 (+) Transcript_4072:125-2266(+)
MEKSKYETLKTLGQGSFGTALLVRNKDDNKKYVMKTIKIHSGNPKERDSAMLEVRLLSNLRHPNIVSYHESFLGKNGELCIVMAFCEGGDLYTRIQNAKNTYFKEEQIIDWFSQMVLALQYIHEKRILHRDLKTQNIFLTEKNVVKLGDFGVSRVLDGTMDMAKTVIGTPYYMSPELFQNKPYSYKSDVWALGCVLYEMTTLKHAFDARDMNGLALKILRGTSPPIPSHYSHELRDMLRNMLHKTPERRPRMADLLELPFIKKRLATFVQEATTVPRLIPSPSPVKTPSPAVKAELLKAVEEKERVERALRLLEEEKKTRLKRKQELLKRGMLARQSSDRVRAAAVVRQSVDSGLAVKPSGVVPVRRSVDVASGVKHPMVREHPLARVQSGHKATPLVGQTPTPEHSPLVIRPHPLLAKAPSVPRLRINPGDTPRALPPSNNPADERPLPALVSAASGASVAKKDPSPRRDVIKASPVAKQQIVKPSSAPSSADEMRPLLRIKCATPPALKQPPGIVSSDLLTNNNISGSGEEDAEVVWPALEGEVEAESDDDEVEKVRETLLQHTRRIMQLEEEVERQERRAEDEANLALVVDAYKRRLSRPPEPVNIPSPDDDDEDVVVQSRDEVGETPRTGKLRERIQLLKQQCTQVLGAATFDKAYRYLRDQQSFDYASMQGEGTVSVRLAEILGKENTAHYWAIIDQIIFCEDNLRPP